MRGLLVWIPAALAIVAALILLAPARAQDAASRELHFGAGSCAAQACHGGAFPDRAEYKTWATRDEHSRAFEHLTEPLGRRIGERLGLDPTTSPRCLNCHGTIGVDTADTFDQADGVSCELCHGGARRWLGPHAAPDWAARAPSEKERLGLRDLTTPAKRAKVCVDCHVGGPGRDLEHDIMAAGHPPLVFDAASFLAAMPPHWKDEAGPRTVQTWLEGLRAGAQAHLDRVVRAAAAGGPLDYTLFDCYSCHHPIYAGSVYEARDPEGVPGTAPIELAQLRTLLVATDRMDLAAGLARPANPAEAARRALRDVALLELEIDEETLRRRVAAHLARIAAGEAHAPRTEMQQLAFAARALAGDRDSTRFREAYDAVDAALAPEKRYDDDACAGLVRALLGVGR